MDNTVWLWLQSTGFNPLFGLVFVWIMVMEIPSIIKNKKTIKNLKDSATAYLDRHLPSVWNDRTDHLVHDIPREQWLKKSHLDVWDFPINLKIERLFWFIFGLIAVIAATTSNPWVLLFMAFAFSVRFEWGVLAASQQLEKIVSLKEQPWITHNRQHNDLAYDLAEYPTSFPNDPLAQSQQNPQSTPAASSTIAS